MTDAVLEALDLTKDFGGFIAVKQVNLQVQRGSIHALIGPNGAGKTTLFNLLTGFLPASYGSIRYRGRDITGLHPADVTRLGIVRSFQISAVFPRLTAFENIRIALQRKLGTSFHFWLSSATLSVLNRRADELLEAVGLSDVKTTRAGELPYGRKRALELATTLALDPELMLLDEPTAGLGHEDVSRITDLIKRVASSRTTLIVEHNLKVVSAIADRITVLQRGQVVAEGSYDEISRDREVRKAYLGGGHA